MTTCIVYEKMGAFRTEVFRSDSEYEIGDYLADMFTKQDDYDDFDEFIELNYDIEAIKE